MEDAANSDSTAKRTADNLKPYRFQPGQSGNPSGRPKCVVLSRAYRSQLEEQCPVLPGKTWAEAIALALARAALKGNVAAAGELADRCEGKPRMALTVSREEEQADVYGIIQRLTGHGTRALTAGAADDSGAASGEDAAGE